ncbi:MAG: hypothetical protein DRQ89_13375 [Epsilonproteobacteria bacterium]|nr:MAG: hypothetical protein DRQ89_13375 [Campylobacterota bacterium]
MNLYTYIAAANKVFHSAPVWAVVGMLVAVGCSFDETLNVMDNRLLRTLPGMSPPAASRVTTRRSLLYFAQITDSQVADVMTPLRLEMMDTAAVGNFKFSAAWRPQETLSIHALDQTIRQVNREKNSPVAQADGSRAPLAFALFTGDLVDNMQSNELNLVTQTLRGGTVDPFSGKLLTTAGCTDADSTVRKALDARVTSHSYSGVQRYSLYPKSSPLDLRGGFYDPSRTAPGSPVFPSYNSIPRYPGLLDVAQLPFEAEGLRVPFYVIRGNHDALALGNYTASLIDTLGAGGVTVDGCRKPFPSKFLNPAMPPFDAGPLAPRMAEIEKITGTIFLGGKNPEIAPFVPPDDRRAYFSSPAFTAAFTPFHEQAGFAWIDPQEKIASNNHAYYYTWIPRPGLRFVALDTNSEGGGDAGRLAAPQFRWLTSVLESTPSSTLVVVFGHHTLPTLNSDAPDLCPDDPSKCDRDPRRATPFHFGCPLKEASTTQRDCDVRYANPPAPDNLRDLLLGYPNVILYVSGHTHMNRIDAYTTGGGSGFWEVTTSSTVEWPQQSRLLEIMDNQDGSLSIFATVIDPFAGLEAPPTGSPAAGFNHEALVAAGHRIAQGDVDWRQGGGVDAEGRFRNFNGQMRNIDSNVELSLPDPRPDN